MLLIKNGKIITMTGVTHENGCVLIENGKIKAVGTKIEESKEYEVIDASGAWVLPGFIDAHCHIGIFEQDMGFEGSDGNESTDPVTPELRAIDAINPMDSAFKEAAQAGITTVMTGPGSANVIGGQFVAMKTMGVSIDDMIILEPAAMKVAFGENPKRIYSSKKQMPSTRMGTAAKLRETLIKAQNYRMKKERASKKDESFDIDFKMEALIPVLEKKIPIKAHAHRADDILTAIRIAREFDLKMTLDHCTEGHLIVDYIKDCGYPALVGPTLTARKKVETKNKTFKTLGILSKEGIKTAIITDHPVVPINYLPLCAAMAVKEGMDMDEAFKAITINAAEICNIEKRVGSIEVGKDADIAIFDGNPMEIFTNTLYTIINGKVVYNR
ncbi:amidohydrolase [Clostridium omnivorum]|uniref:Amidohydrolase n=1 Tax=Clostridium omnivorum TaxID=1604902 RepID=A0ABQ5NAH8_9CLOT|nr:amidohydrolase [Clostridium sp. E14]GLC32077.1 amidohydrolase [Clostridium sp. E14]